MTDRKELTRQDIHIAPDMETDSKNQVVAYIETWFDVDEKFGIHTADDDDTWLNMYAIMNLPDDTLTIRCIISSSEKEEEFTYEPTQNEAMLIKDMIRESCLLYHNCSLDYFVSSNQDSDITM